MSDEQKAQDALAAALQQEAEELGVAIPTRKEVDRYRRLRTIDNYDIAAHQLLSERVACAKHKPPAIELDLSPSDPDDMLARMVRNQYKGKRA